MQIYKALISTALFSCSALTIANTALPSTVYIGYWNNLNTNYAGTKDNPTLLQTSQAGYNIIPVAFGVIQGTAVSLYDNKYNNNGYGIDKNKEQFIADIKAAQANGAKILLTFGGGSNSSFSWNPDQNNAIAAANSVINFLAEYGFDGVDFDLEAGMYTDQRYLISFISQLRSKAKELSHSFPNGIIITGAPQLVSSTEFMWNGNTSLNDLLPSDACSGNPCFDALSIQNYNNNPQPSLADAYDAIYNQMSSHNNHGATKIVIGVPDNPASGGGYIEPGTVKNGISEIQSKTTSSQFGGIMVWTASSDYTENGWNFINQIKE